MAPPGTPRTNRMLNAASSVYSRGPEIPPLCITRKRRKTQVPAGHHLPEITLLDHQIAQARGTTMALETTRSSLQAAKKERRISLPEDLEQKRRQLKRQDDENRFFGECLRIFDDLATAAMAVSNNLMLLFELEPELRSARHRRIDSAIRELQDAISHSRSQEAQAREEWDRRADRPRIRPLSARWI